MKHAYKKVFIVRDCNNIPLRQEPMTLQQAINRYNREIKEAKKLGLLQSDKDFNIYDIEKGEIVL